MQKSGWKAGAVGRWCFGNAAVLLLLFCCGASFALPPESTAEQDLFRFTNEARMEQGLSPLQWDDALAVAAAQHLRLMVESGQLSHQFPGEADVTARAAAAGAHFQVIAENVALGPSAESIQRQWMLSVPHRENILDPRLNAIGFAVARGGGSLYAVADFARSVPDLTPEQAEAAVGRLIAARGVKVTGPSQDARQSCVMNQGSAGQSKPLFLMRWQSSELSQLPPALEERLSTGRYHSAAVGACPSPAAETGFASYRLAVLLY